MRRALFTLCLVCSSPQAWAQDLPPIELREKARADGAALRLGDVFRIEGAAAAREIAPAPPPGEAGIYTTAFLAAAARAAGFSWQPQAGFTEISIEGPRPDAPQRPPSQFAETTRGYRAAISTREPAAAPLIKRGEDITLIYSQGPLRVSTRARALQTATTAGESVRVLTLPAERQIEARVTGPGEARVSQ